MTVCVIGAGLAGSATTLELRRHHVNVLVLDRACSPMNDASRFNEGKIHLGYVYACDPTTRTEDLMIRGALTFQPLMRRWLASAWDAVGVSAAFEYAVHPQSVASPQFLAGRYLEIQDKIAEFAPQDAQASYPGTAAPADGAWRSQTGHPQAGGNLFQSQERAVEPFQMADAVVAALEQSGAEIRCGVDVVGVRRGGSKYFVDTRDGTLGPFDAVVNASWVSGQAIDRTMGLELRPSVSCRFKYFLRVAKLAIADILPCRTIVVGPFGDIVTYGRDLAYLSWYPAGRVAWSHALISPVLPSRPPPAQAQALITGIIDGLAAQAPGVQEIDPRRDDVQVFGGPILAVGVTDIDDRASGLHRRDAIGVTSVDGYHSVRTGKLTTAPLFGREAAEAVLAS
jgi:glycine/D-amino acid oxidase-like deaminating enzyme/energy-converting hydrogenase Eha subunit A